MEKIFRFLLVLGVGCLVVTPGKAQFKSLLNKVKAKVDQRVDNKVSSTIDKGLDKAEGKGGTGSGDANAPAANGGTPEAKAPEAKASEAPAGVKAFSKYDFIPGERILYTEDFAQEAVGELPTAWNSNGSAEVVSLDKAEGRWLRMHKPIAYLTANQKTFGQNYTIEFDLILQLKNNGWMYPEFTFGVLSSRDLQPGDNSLLKDFQQFSALTTTLYPGENNSSRAKLQTALDGKSYFKGEPISVSEIQQSWGRPIHIAIQVQKERYRCWINERKAFDVPKAVPLNDTMNQVRFEVGNTNYPEDAYGVYIGNLRIATGLPDTRHKLIEDGKFSTNGILFDLQSAVIRPESYGVVKEIAGVLKENPSVRVKVLGHTSSDGDDAANLELSKKRAAAVKDLLVSEWQIDGSRIETEGKGETQPVADNKTKEGRAQNRRVEFIKL